MGGCRHKVGEMVTLEGFGVDAAQVRSRAVACALSVAAFGAALTVVWQADDRSVYLQRCSMEGIVGLNLIVSALAIIHIRTGVLTEIGVLPRGALRKIAQLIAWCGIPVEVDAEVAHTSLPWA